MVTFIYNVNRLIELCSIRKLNLSFGSRVSVGQIPIFSPFCTAPPIPTDHPCPSDRFEISYSCSESTSIRMQDLMLKYITTYPVVL